MAEILLSLTIIGVVAAITLPSLTGNINERTWNTQRKALFARFSQAMSLMPSLNGYGTFTAEQKDESGSITQSAVDTATETFITDGLSKVLKINNICDADHLTDCGIPSQIINLNNNKINLNNLTTLKTLNSSAEAIRAAAFETQNGESILVYYNPKCKPFVNETTTHSPLTTMCANFIYDLNGNKGPNTIGKDMGFITAFNATDPNLVFARPVNNNLSGGGKYTQQEAISGCAKQYKNSRLPSIDELSSLFINTKLIDLPGGVLYWSSTNSPISINNAWALFYSTGNIYNYAKTDTLYVRCIER